MVDEETMALAVERFFSVLQVRCFWVGHGEMVDRRRCLTLCSCWIDSGQEQLPVPQAAGGGIEEGGGGVAAADIPTILFEVGGLPCAFLIGPGNGNDGDAGLKRVPLGGEEVEAAVKEAQCWCVFKREHTPYEGGAWCACCVFGH